MINIKSFNSITEAELVKNILKENSIEGWVQKGGIKFPGDMGDSYGAELSVAEKDVAKAKEILKVYSE